MVSMINPVYLDVDFKPITDQIGGCNPRDIPFGKIPRTAAFEEVVPAYSRDEMVDLIKLHFSMEFLAQMTKNQQSEGSCTSNATSQGFEHIFVRQFGSAKYIETSPISLYRQCASNGREGSSLPCNLQRMRDTGILPTKNERNIKQCQELGLVIPDHHFHPNVGYSTRPGRDWEDTGQLFRIDEFFDIKTFEGVLTALLRHYMVVYARAGHCILAVTPIFEDGRFVVKYHNSWGRWGDNGYGYDSERAVKSGLPYGFFAIRTVRSPFDLVV
jgi:hypothetical protein